MGANKQVGFILIVILLLLSINFYFSDAPERVLRSVAPTTKLATVDRDLPGNLGTSGRNTYFSHRNRAISVMEEGAVCIQNSDCIPLSVHETKVCIGKDLYLRKPAHLCKNPGKIDAYCEIGYEDIILEECAITCGKLSINEDPICIKQEHIGNEVACAQDSDCGNNRYYCDHTTETRKKPWGYICQNPGSYSSKCEYQPNPVEEKCEAYCVEEGDSAICITEEEAENMPVACTKTEDCFVYMGEPYCQNGNIYQKFPAKAFCAYPEKPYSYCVYPDIIGGRLIESCGFGCDDSNGIVKCAELSCETHEDCGGLLQNNFCVLEYGIFKKGYYTQYSGNFCEGRVGENGLRLVCDKASNGGGIAAGELCDCSKTGFCEMKEDFYYIFSNFTDSAPNNSEIITCTPNNDTPCYNEINLENGAKRINIVFNLTKEQIDSFPYRYISMFIDTTVFGIDIIDQFDVTVGFSNSEYDIDFTHNQITNMYQTPNPENPMIQIGNFEFGIDMTNYWFTPGENIFWFEYDDVEINERFAGYPKDLIKLYINDVVMKVGPEYTYNMKSLGSSMFSFMETLPRLIARTKVDIS